MNENRTSFAKLIQQFPAMPTSGKLAVVGVTGMLLLAFTWMMLRDSRSGYTPLSFGKPFTTEEIIHAEQIFHEAGLNDFRREGNLFYVPAQDVATYHGALINGGALPAGFGAALEQQLEGGLGVFESSRTTQQRKDIALAKFLQQTIQSIPSIDYASVAWARPQTNRWPHNEKTVTATVTVRPKRNHELTQAQIRSFRSAVASMIPDLSPAHITVLDVSTGLSYTADDLDGDLDSGLMKRIQHFTQSYEEKIAKTLSYIPDVIVTVNVDVDELKSRVERIQKIDTKGSFKVYEASESRSEDIRNQYPVSEPGVRNNQPASLQTASGPTENRQIIQEDTKSTNAPSFTVTEQEFFAAMPKAVQVSVKIPRSYYEAVAAKSGLSKPASADTSDDSYERAIADIEQKEIDRVKSSTAVLIPKGSDPASISVSSYQAVRDSEAPLEPGILQQVAQVGTDWGGKIGLFALACWGLWAVGKSLPSTSDEPAEKLEEQEPSSQPSKESAQPVIKKETSTRDKLQVVVRDNPDITAGILEEWLDYKKA